jgi:hypothetical protein
VTDQVLANLTLFQKCWTGTVREVLWGHWLLLDTGLRATHTVLERAAPAPPPVEAVERLIRRAKERMRLGLAPPPEIYHLPYRDRIDWGEFPAWARPSDPELFGESGHEG